MYSVPSAGLSAKRSQKRKKERLAVCEKRRKYRALNRRRCCSRTRRRCRYRTCRSRHWDRSPVPSSLLAPPPSLAFVVAAVDRRQVAGVRGRRRPIHGRLTGTPRRPAMLGRTPCAPAPPSRGASGPWCGCTAEAVSASRIPVSTTVSGCSPAEEELSTGERGGPELPPHVHPVEPLLALRRLVAWPGS